MAKPTAVGDLALATTLALWNELDALEFVVDFDDVGLVRLVILEFSDLFFNVKDIVEVEFFLSSK